MLVGKASNSLDWYHSIRDVPQVSDERWKEAVDCIIGDYCQNLALPFLGKHQPGKTYYFSPLTVNCFGIANVGLDKALLNAYIYHEGEGKKGGNNVASLICKYLNDSGLINHQNIPRKELNIVMDNCGGQNKNKFVLRLAPLFVELCYYRRVNIIFLVAGHTKNAAIRLFNLLKLQYRKSQVYKMEQLEEILNVNKYVECVKVGKEDFYNFGKFKDKLYKQTPLLGNTKKFQLFYSHDEDMGALYGKDSNSSTTATRMDLKRGNDTVRKQVLAEFKDNIMQSMETVNDCEEGIQKIKQVELYTKWQKHIPDEYKSPLYNNPGEDILLSVKEDRKHKLQYVKERRLATEQVEEVATSSGKLLSKKSPTQKQIKAKQKDPPKPTTAVKAPPKKSIKRTDKSQAKKTASRKKK
jgi:hypothetical protein